MPEPMPTPPIPYIDRDRAPVVFFDQSPAAACSNGVIAITLSSDVYVMTAGGQVATEHAIVAHLKTSIAGARTLRTARRRPERSVRVVGQYQLLACECAQAPHGLP